MKVFAWPSKVVIALYKVILDMRRLHYTCWWCQMQRDSFHCASLCVNPDLHSGWLTLLYKLSPEQIGVGLPKRQLSTVILVSVCCSYNKKTLQQCVRLTLYNSVFNQCNLKGRYFIGILRVHLIVVTHIGLCFVDVGGAKWGCSCTIYTPRFLLPVGQLVLVT